VRLHKKMKKSLTPSLHLVMAILGQWASHCAHAARPFVTDDARTVELGGCQIETFYKEQRAYSGSEFWFLPACNPFGVELTVGGNRIEDDKSLVLQAKTLLKPLETNGSGFAFSLGTYYVNPPDGGNVWSPYINGIGSFSFLNDRAVVHVNLGAIHDRIAGMDRATWGIGLEALLLAPKLYGIFETYGQSADKPTLDGGLRYWIVLNRLQIDGTVGEQKSEPVRRFYTVGLRFLF
jgi:hypothetical protein